MNFVKEENSDNIIIEIDTTTYEGYEIFIKCKNLPKYNIVGNKVVTDTLSFSYTFGGIDINRPKHTPVKGEFDYQKYVVEKALEREKYAAALECGLGKCRISLSFAHDVVEYTKNKVLYLCPLQVMEDTQRECERVFGYRMSNLRNEAWKTDIALINYESMRDIDMKDVSGIVLDESSILKGADSQTRNYLTNLAANIRFRLAASATPSPNDQTEYGTHAVWLGQATTLKEYYSRYFRKDGVNWIIKPHAVDSFYSNLSSWACYIHSPSKLGFQQGAELGYEPNYIIQSSIVDRKYMPHGRFMSKNEIDLQNANKLFSELRADFTQDRFKKSVEVIEGKKAIIWCSRNNEEALYKKTFPNCRVINGSTPIEKRVEYIDMFRNGEIDKLISKPTVMGFGVNIPEAECQLFSGYNFSFEQFYQAVRRSHRFGRKGILDVYIPVSEPEKPIWRLLNRKIDTFQKDVLELQSRFFNN